MKVISCNTTVRFTHRICGQHRRCQREQGHTGFCMTTYYGWPVHWLSKAQTVFTTPLSVK